MSFFELLLYFCRRFDRRQFLHPMAAFSILRKDRPGELLAQSGGGEIFDAVAFRIAAGDVGGAEQYVPEEQ